METLEERAKLVVDLFERGASYVEIIDGGIRLSRKEYEQIVSHTSPQERIARMCNAIRDGTSHTIRTGAANVPASDFLKWTNVWKWGLAATIVSILMTVISIAQTYAGFETVALTTWPIFWLILINIGFTWFLILLLRLIIRPTNTVKAHMIYAALVALTFQTLIHTDLDLTKPLAGSEESKLKPLQVSINLGSAVYAPIVRLLTRQINEPVRAAMRSEIAELQKRYSDEDGVKKLQQDFLNELAYSLGLDKDERDAHHKEVQQIVESELTPKDKVRDIGLLMYRIFGRRVVKDLATGTSDNTSP